MLRAFIGQPHRLTQPDAAAEASFVACISEENVIRALFISMDGNPAQYEPLIAVIRQRVKQELVSAALEAAAQRQQPQQQR